MLPTSVLGGAKKSGDSLTPAQLRLFWMDDRLTYLSSGMFTGPREGAPKEPRTGSGWPDWNSFHKESFGSSLASPAVKLLAGALDVCVDEEEGDNEDECAFECALGEGGFALEEEDCGIARAPEATRRTARKALVWSMPLNVE